MIKELKIGIIGSSDGNGHPYSWSAIFNGYNKKIMEDCEFPAIPNYLNKQKFPDVQIADAKVTHIWTQDKNLSKKIASSALIDNVVENYKDLIGNVDAVILARDDAENHFRFASLFLKEGMPIFIDKPLALSISDAKKIFNLQIYDGQIFSCSSMRYSTELKLNNEQKKIVGKIRSIHGFAPKSWDKYAIHALEPIIQLIPNRGKILNHNTLKKNDKNELFVNFESGVKIKVETCVKSISPISLCVIGTKGSVNLIFTDTFNTFRSTLKNFIEGIRNKDIRTSSRDIFDIVELIELGRIK